MTWFKFDDDDDDDDDDAAYRIKVACFWNNTITSSRQLQLYLLTMLSA